jgi:ABC-2 type transport system permease protein
VYRGDFMLGTLMRFLPTLTQIFLWYAIYDVISSAASVNSTAGPDGDIAGYSYHQMVAYYLMVIISRAFSSMPGLTPGIAEQVRNGEIKKFLIQPVDMVGCLLVQRVAHKLVYYLIAALPFALVFWLCRDFFVAGWPPADVLVVFFTSLILAFLLGFFLECCIGLVAFWFLEVTSLTFIYMLMNFLLSGHMFPLELLPDSPVNIRGLVEVLPLQYLAYFPAAVFLGKIRGPAMYQELAIEFAWVLFFIALARFLWWRGVRRYSGFGG